MNQYQDNQKRRVAILKRILDLEHLSYQKLSEEYYVSRSSIANDISYVKNVFAKEGLSLTFDNSGTYFERSEIQIQKVLKRAVLNHIHDIDTIFVKRDSILYRKIKRIVYNKLNRRKNHFVWFFFCSFQLFKKEVYIFFLFGKK